MNLTIIALIPSNRSSNNTLSGDTKLAFNQRIRFDRIIYLSVKRIILFGFQPLKHLVYELILDFFQILIGYQFNPNQHFSSI